MSKYDMDMTIFDDPEKRRKEKIRQRMTSINANKQAEYLDRLFDEIEKEIQRNRKMIRRLHIETQSHPDHLKSEIDAFKLELEKLRDKLERLKDMMKRYDNEVARKSAQLRTIKKSTGYSPVRTQKKEALQKGLEIAKQKRDDLKSRVNDIKRRINSLKDKLR